jgi:hypothetical protein
MKKDFEKQELRIAKDFGARRVISSGALWFAKGDVRTSHFLIECKYTGSKQFRIDMNLWKKIEGEAIRDDLRIPLLQIDLEGGKFPIVFYRTLDIWDSYIIPRKTIKGSSILMNRALFSPEKAPHMIYWEPLKYFFSYCTLDEFKEIALEKELIEEV